MRLMERIEKASPRWRRNFPVRHDRAGLTTGILFAATAMLAPAVSVSQQHPHGTDYPANARRYADALAWAFEGTLWEGSCLKAGKGEIIPLRRLIEGRVLFPAFLPGVLLERLQSPLNWGLCRFTVQIYSMLQFCASARIVLSSVLPGADRWTLKLKVCLRRTSPLRGHFF